MKGFRHISLFLLFAVWLFAQGVECWSYTDDFLLEVDLDCLDMFPDQVNASIAGTGYTMLHWASERGQKDQIELLIENGADVGIGDFFSNTPLHLIARNNEGLPEDKMAEIAELLIRHGADPEARNANGMMPLDIARESGQAYLTNFFESKTKTEKDSYAPLIEEAKVMWDDEEETDALDLVTTYTIADIEY